MNHSMYQYPRRSTVINFFAGPGAGKSTISSGLFYEMKMHGIECELVPEYAKKCVWEETTPTLNDQLFVFAQQAHAIRCLDGKVDYIIVDSPLLFSTIYCNTSDKFKAVVLEEHSRYHNINYFVERNNPYHRLGRIQTEEESMVYDAVIKAMLRKYAVPYNTINTLTDPKSLLAEVTS